MEGHRLKTVDDVLERVDELRDLNQSHLKMRQITRAVLNGGAEAVATLVADSDLDYVPAANMIHSAIERTAQKLIFPPHVRVDAPAGRGGSRARNYAEKRERIVEAYDEASNLKMQIPQAARWVPGYGFAVWSLNEGVTHAGQPYPAAELRDPYGCLPGPWTVHQQPDDVAFVRQVSEYNLRKIYPTLPRGLKPQRYTVGGAVILDQNYNSNWASQDQTNMLRVIEYQCHEGTYMVLEDAQILLDYMPTPEGVGAPFVVAKRFAFDQLMGQFEHAVGLQQMMVRMNILAFLSVQDAVFAETNIYGEMQSDEYRKGRNATNHFDPGTRVEKLTDPSVFQQFQQIDRLERQFRMTGAYPVTDDSQSPNSYVTGRGLQELTSASDNVVQEYQLVLRDAMERLDTKRLMWDEARFGNVERTMPGTHKGSPYVESWTPNTHINGNHKTRRVYGILSGLDSSSKLVGLLQISQAGWMDDITAMENIEGIDNIQQVRERLERQKAEALLEQAMLAMVNGQPPDLRIMKILVDSLEDGPRKRQFEEVFFPEPEEPDPAAMPPEGMPPEAGMPPGQEPLAAPGEDPTTIMSRLFSSGTQTSAAQTVQSV